MNEFQRPGPGRVIDIKFISVTHVGL